MLTFPLPFQGQATGILSATASAWDVETALEALAEIDNVIVTGDSGGPWTVEFVGAQAGTNVARLDGDAARLTSGTLAREISYSWDIGTRLVAASDPDSSYTLAYDDLDRLVSIDNQGTPNIPRVVLNSSYDVSGNRTRLAAVIDGTDDFVNDYTYDHLNRMTRVDQYGVAGGHAVAEKRVDMAYNSLGQFTQIVRYSALSGTPSDEVATSVYTYDAAHRLVGLSHNRGGQPLFTPYSWTYDPLDRITQMVNSDGTSVFTYDQTDQLTGADHSYQTDEAYQYDANGNRTGGGYVTGSNNQLLEDGTYRYEYDAEGNRTAKEAIATGEREEYTWDHRNRLVRFLKRNSQGAIVLDVHYTYDVFDRRIAKSVDPDGDGPQEPTFTWFVYDNPSVVTGAADRALVGADHIVLEFTGSQPAVLKYRYLHGPVVDQVFAREDVESLWQPGELLWALGDHLGTVRDLIDSSGNVVNHLRYEAFGRITSETNAAVDFLFAFTGRERDEESGLFYYRARYYDPAVGRFMSEDPLGFAAGDANLARYVGNATTIYVDPTGREERRRNNDRITPEEEIKKTLPGRIIDYLSGKGLDENIEHNRHGLSNIDDLLNKGNLTPLGRREFHPETVALMERLAAFGVNWNSYVLGGAFVHPSVWQGKFWHRKSTARWPRSVTPQNLRQQLAAEEVVNNPAKGIALGPSKDPTWPASEGWVKMAGRLKPGGDALEVHYMYNPRTGEVDDVKIIVDPTASARPAR
ncbi:MAG: hypothetical protein KatS3mg109_2106 [Pirellulaceae bacterium]|nr:MAG: hypothetical protein KatS3mg109_2106 [Pirellulaceae bacterium]